MIYRNRAFGRSSAQEQFYVGDGLGGDVSQRCLQPSDLRRDGPDPKDFLV